MTSFEKICLKPSYYPFNNIGHIDLNLLCINNRHIKNTNIIAHEIKYITKKNIADQYIDKELPLGFSFYNIRAYIIEENKDKYLVFALTINNKKGKKMYKNFEMKLKNKFRTTLLNAIPLNCISLNAIPLNLKKIL